MATTSAAAASRRAAAVARSPGAGAVTATQPGAERAQAGPGIGGPAPGREQQHEPSAGRRDDRGRDRPAERTRVTDRRDRAAGQRAGDLAHHRIAVLEVATGVGEHDEHRPVHGDAELREPASEAGPRRLVVLGQLEQLVEQLAERGRGPGRELALGGRVGVGDGGRGRVARPEQGLAERRERGAVRRAGSRARRPTRPSPPRARGRSRDPRRRPRGPAPRRPPAAAGARRDPGRRPSARDASSHRTASREASSSAASGVPSGATSLGDPGRQFVDLRGQRGEQGHVGDSIAALRQDTGSHAAAAMPCPAEHLRAHWTARAVARSPPHSRSPGRQRNG